MKAQSISSLLNFSYVKTADEISNACIAKVQLLEQKITERELRITRVREEYKITDLVLIDLLAQARRAAQAGQGMSHYNYVQRDEDDEPEEVVVGAGVINNLMTERDFIDAEKGYIEKLEMIARNIAPLILIEGGVPHEIGHKLTTEELKFLEF